MDMEFWKPVIAGQVRHLLTLAAGVLVTDGLIHSDQEGAFVQIGSSIAIGALSMGWTWWQTSGRAQLQKNLQKMTGTKTSAAAAAVAEVAPATPPPSVVALAAKVAPALLLALLLWPADAGAQAKRPPFTGNLPADAQNLKDKLSGQNQGSNEAAQGGVASQGGDRLASILAKPFNDLADFINTDAAEAATLATAIPGLQDGHGQQCWMAMGQFTAVIKAHPIPVTLHAATDLEAFRLANMAANNLCSNVHCTQVFSDLSNAVQQVAGQVGGVLVTGGLQIPSLNSLCSKVPQVIVAAPVSTSTPTAPTQP